MKLARLVTVDSMKVCEHDIVLLRYGVTIVGLLLYFLRLCAARLVTLGKGESLVIDRGRCCFAVTFARCLVCTIDRSYRYA